MARTLDLTANVPPDEPMFVLFDGTEHKVTKLTVWESFELQSLSEGIPEQAARVRELLAKSLPTVKPETLDNLTPEAYRVLWFYLLNGRAPAKAATSEPDQNPTPPE